MERIRVAKEYTEDYLMVDRPMPLCDDHLDSLFDNTINGYNNWDVDHTPEINNKFINECSLWIQSSKINNLTGFESFTHINSCIGCTQFIDNIYMQSEVQVIQNEYRYHERLGNKYVTTLKPNTPLIISMPFPMYGDVHPNMQNILDECLEKNIPVHIDGAWVTCTRNLNFNFDHPSIKSFAISLSKGLGLGWNRIGLRYSREKIYDSISIMNDYDMTCRHLLIVGHYIINQIPTDYFWNNYSTLYSKVCNDFNLVELNSIHIAKKQNGQIVGVGPLMRYLMRHE